VTWRHRAWAVAAVTFHGVAGAIRQSTGSYDVAWWTTGALAILAALMVLVIPHGIAIATQDAPTTPDATLSPADSM
jgi:hypothetical protein